MRQVPRHHGIAVGLHKSENEVPQKYDAIITAADDTSVPLTRGFGLEVLFPTLPSEQAYDPHLFEHGAIYKGGHLVQHKEDSCLTISLDLMQ